MPKSHPRFLFSRCALAGDRAWFLAEDNSQFRFLQLRDSKWIQRTLPWPASSLAGHVDPAVQTFAVGLEGEVMRGTSTGFTNEKVDPNEQLIKKYGVLREVRIIGGLAYVCGMSRQVYQRSNAGKWLAISDAILESPANSFGFNSIHGSDSSNIIAVGLKGEVWLFNGKEWHQIESPTTNSLNRIILVNPNHAFACGQAGSLIEIKNANASYAAKSQKAQNFYGLEFFKKKLFVASLKGLFMVVDGEIEQVEPYLGPNFTTGYLEAANGELWSIGAHHIAKTKDGKKWSLVSCKL